MLSKFFDITPSDSTIVPAHEAIYVGGTGSLVLTVRSYDSTGVAVDTDIVLNNVAAGVFHPITGVQKVKAASTATGIVGAR